MPVHLPQTAVGQHLSGSKVPHFLTNFSYPLPPKQSWKKWKINANNCSEKKSEQAPEHQEGRKTRHNTGSQVDRQLRGDVGDGEWKKGFPGAMAMAQFCLIILIIFYAAYICALALRACIAIKILRPTRERSGTGSGNVLHWMPKESWRGRRRCVMAEGGCRRSGIAKLVCKYYSNPSQGSSLCSPQAALARCCAKSARKKI